MKSTIYPLLALILSIVLYGCSSDTQDYDANLPKNVYDLDGHSIACLSGSLIEHFITDSLPNAKLVSLSSIAELMTSVATGKSDYMLVDKASIMTIAPEDKGCKIMFETHVASGYYAFGFNHPESDLSRQFNSFMETIETDGTLQSIIDKWAGEDSQNETMPQFSDSLDKEPIQVGVYLSNFPFCFLGPEGAKGIEPEILYRFGEKSGHPIQIVGYDFAALMPSLASRKSDMISGTITVTEERARKVLFSTPYYYSVSVCLGKADNTGNGQSVGQWLKGGINDNLIAEGRWKMILDGLWMTILISVCSILLGAVIGSIICWMRMSRVRFLQGFARVYLEILRGIPMLVFLMLMFYVVFASSKVTATTVAIIAFAMNFGAFTSEIFRTGIDSIDKGQKEAGIALGFSTFQTFIFVILPQAAKKIVPVFKNEAVSLVKNTSIVGYIAIQDLTKVSDLIRSRTFDAFFPLIVITIIYFILAWLLGHILDMLSKRV